MDTALVIKKEFTAQQTISQEALDRITDSITDLEAGVCCDIGYSAACGLIEHECHYPKDYLDADVDEAEMHFDEIADLAYSITQKAILTALIRMNWLSEHADFIKKQQGWWDRNRDEVEAERATAHSAWLEGYRAGTGVKK